ncbi:MAG: hypothetical protein Q4G13_03260 [Moraxella sp.]|nr:hypothetical protein [Moraxella sp.]
MINAFIHKDDHKLSPCYGYALKENNGIYEIDIYQNSKKLFIPKNNLRSFGTVVKNDKCFVDGIRLQDYSFDEYQYNDDVYIRGMGTRINLYGLSSRYQDIQKEYQDKKDAFEKSKLENMKRYEERIEMKNFPLWLYPLASDVRKYQKRRTIHHYAYGIKGTIDPLTNQPRLISCRTFDIDDQSLERDRLNIFDTLDARNAIANSNKPSHSPYSCGYSYYFNNHEIILYTRIFFAPGIVRNIDKVFLQTENKLDSYTKLPQPSL